MQRRLVAHIEDEVHRQSDTSIRDGENGALVRLRPGGSGHQVTDETLEVCRWAFLVLPVEQFEREARREGNRVEE
jgi:hypothetical protein